MKDEARIRDARLARAYATIANIAVEAGKVYPDLYWPLNPAEDGLNPKVLELVLASADDDGDAANLKNGLEALIDAAPVLKWMLDAVTPKEAIAA